MAEESGDGQEKTEEPSQRKLDKAKEDGKVVSSKEMFVFTTLFGGLLILMAMINYGRDLLMHWSGLFSIAPYSELDTLLSLNFREGVLFIIQMTLIFGVPLMVIVLATQAAVGGFVF